MEQKAIKAAYRVPVGPAVVGAPVTGSKPNYLLAAVIESGLIGTALLLCWMADALR